MDSDPMGFEDYCNTYLQSSQGAAPCAPSELWAVAEDYIRGSSAPELRKMLSEIDALFKMPGEQDRRQPYGYPLQSVDPREGALDEMTIQAEYDDAVAQVLSSSGAEEGERRRGVLVREAEATLKRITGIRVPIELVPPGTLPETTFKARRVVDERPRH